MGWRRNAVRIYRTLLLAYPAEFRHQYGAEMERLFDDRSRSEPPVRLWLESLADIAITVPTEHLHTLAADLRYGGRMLASAPSFTVVALLVMALGIGATTAVFSLVNAVLLRSFPYGEPQGLVYLYSPNSQFQGTPDEMAPNDPDFYDWQRLSHSFTSLTMLKQRMSNFVHDGTVERVGSALVTGSFFETLEAKPQLGRAIEAEDDTPGRANVAVISDRLWHERFGGATDVIGRVLQINRKKYTVIGVMPKDFGYPFEGDIPYGMTGFKRTDLWLPVALSAKEKTDRTTFASNDATIGRLRPGVSVAQAQAELKSIESQLNSLYPPMWRGWTALVRPLVTTIVGPVQKMLWLLLGAVGCVLLIACSNVANLLLAKVATRRQEIGVRMALGAERTRLIRQMLTESLLLSCLGGSLGMLLAFAAVRLLVRLNPGNIPRFEQASVDSRVLFIAVVLSVMAGLLSGLAPTVAASRVSVNEILKQGGNKGTAGTSNRWRQTLVLIEVALSVILLGGAGLMIRSFIAVQAVNPGFSPSALTMRLSLDERYKTPEQRMAFFQGFMQAAQRVPGVLKVGAADVIPLDHRESVAAFEIKGYGKPRDMIDNRSVTSGYFGAIGLPLLHGRDFDDHDLKNNSVAIVNEAFAKTFFGASNPLGSQIRSGIGDLTGVPWITVIGVIANLRQTTLEEKPRPEVFRPYQAGLHGYAYLAFRLSVPPRVVIATLRNVLHDMDPALGLEDIHTMRDRMAEANARRRFQTVLLGGFAGLALLLACVGLYGLIAYSVKRRTAEIGVRMALGGSQRQVLGMVLREGLKVVGLGLFFGIVAALGTMRLIGAWLYEIGAGDPITFLSVAATLLLVAVCACLVPAIAATRVEPVTALRYE
ncbi:MAG TPA: ABC transporter permease [Bryobacteraceae bacterium]|jgi:putative ABC transport system permease protein